VRLQAVGLDVLEDLIRSGDLDAKLREAIPTLSVGRTVEWTAAAPKTIYNGDTGLPVFCVSSTNLNVNAAKFPAPTRANCAP